MPPKTKYTEQDEQLVWQLFADGLIFKQVAAETKYPIATIYRLLEKSIKKWGNPHTSQKDKTIQKEYIQEPQ